MELVKFRIHNYKSIKDSGDCYLSKKLTIFAGKNESGKTSILEALEDCHEDNIIRETAKPIEGDELPYIDLFFKLPKNEINAILKKANIEKTVSKEAVIGIRKQYGEKAYKLIDNNEIDFNEAETWEEIIPKINDELDGVNENVGTVELANQSAEEYKVTLNQALASRLVNIGGRQVRIPEVADTNKINNAIKLIDSYISNLPQTDRFVKVIVDENLPYFILFSSFEDSFPDSIKTTELSTNTWAKDLEVVSNFRIDKISEANSQAQRNHQNKINTEFTEHFKKYWKQDNITLSVDKDGDVVNFWIMEDGVPYAPSQRSKGQQWYLSFYVRVLARSKEDRPNIILIDEPGLYLHAKAQKDLLNVLNLHSSEYPIIFSTHSPYLISEENLENIRLVEKRNKYTTILGKIHSHGKADKETLTPILTAIGLGINDSITNIEQKDNIVVEGPEDTFYLQAFKLLCRKDIKSNFVYGGGAGNMGKVGTILEGWGCNVSYLYDNDKGKKDGTICLKDTWAVLPEKIHAVTADAKSTIADILSNSDFKKYVLCNESLKYTTKNSEYIKNNGKEKVLLARLFLQKVKNKEVKLDNNSISNIKMLFEKIPF